MVEGRGERLAPGARDANAEGWPARGPARDRARASWAAWSLAFAALAAAGCVADPAPEPVGSRTEPICCGIQCCIIDRLCYFAGDVNPANPCQTCEPFSDFEGWTTDPDCTFDGGPPVSMPDAGPTPDAGAAAADGGAVVRDGGPREAPDAGGCTASPTLPGAPALAGLALALAARGLRRRPR